MPHGIEIQFKKKSLPLDTSSCFRKQYVKKKKKARPGENQILGKNVKIDHGFIIKSTKCQRRKRDILTMM